MKTNVAIELTDEQRSILADALDGKSSKRLATRKEVAAVCRGFIEAVLKEHLETATAEPICANTLEVADPEDRELLRGKAPGYIRGWNMVKRKGEQ